MVFWYVYCLNFLKKSLVTSKHHRQGRAGVKQKVMRLSVSVCVNRASYMYHFATQRGLKEPETGCSFRTTLDPYQEMSLNIAGFIVLSAAGDEVFTNRKNFTRARDSDHGVSGTARLCQAADMSRKIDDLMDLKKPSICQENSSVPKSQVDEQSTEDWRTE